MRRSCVLVLLVLFSWIGGDAQDARAGVTIDAIFRDQDILTAPTGITIQPGDPGPGCSFGGYAGGSVSNGYCMDVILTSTYDMIGLGMSVTYDTDNGLALASMYEWAGVGVAFDKSGNPNKSCTPAGGLMDVGPGTIQSFDCFIASPYNPPTLAAGTYKIGTIVWDTSGTTSGAETIEAVINDLFDGVVASINGNIVTLTSADIVAATRLLTIIPEPGTASLLGLGLVGLTLAARRRRG